MHHWLVIFFLASFVYSDQAVFQQPHINPPKRSEFRDLVWGDLNFLHTTDTHGWYAGHLNQKQYSADWGDFISFAQNLRYISNERNSDLLLVDTGDRHDGNGLSDITAPNGQISTRIFIQQDYDLITLGNHELYTEDNSDQEYQLVARHFGDKYVSSNVEYHLDNKEWVPFGNKYRYFTTPSQNTRILALSFMFDFKWFNAKTRVFPVEETLSHPWFKNLTETIQESDIDVLVVFGHLPVTDNIRFGINKLHLTLRKFYPNVVIQYFGGHSHIRDFVVLDSNSTALQSGRYCETVGWLSIRKDEKQPSFSRRYIDFNKESFIHHSNKTIETQGFDTEKGSSLSKFITKARLDLNLTFSYGNIPSSYFMYEHPYGHPNNIFTFLNHTILTRLSPPQDRANNNRLTIINANSIRYDLYKGTYTKDTEFIVSPFQNNWNYITVPKNIALRIEGFLNKRDYIASISTPEKKVMLSKVSTIAQKYKSYGLNYQACPIVDKKGLKRGLTTFDDYGCDGDDVLHNTIDYYPSPNVITSYQDLNETDDRIDVVYYNFIEPYILEALNILDRTKVYDKNDVHYYGNESTGSLITNYVSEVWNN